MYLVIIRYITCSYNLLKYITNCPILVQTSIIKVSFQSLLSFCQKHFLTFFFPKNSTLNTVRQFLIFPIYWFCTSGNFLLKKHIFPRFSQIAFSKIAKILALETITKVSCEVVKNCSHWSPFPIGKGRVASRKTLISGNKCFKNLFLQRARVQVHHLAPLPYTTVGFERQLQC